MVQPRIHDFGYLAPLWPAMQQRLTDEVLALTQALVGHPSVSPDDAGCQELLIGRLEGAGFAVERMRFGEVDNFWAAHPE